MKSSKLKRLSKISKILEYTRNMTLLLTIIFGCVYSFFEKHYMMYILVFFLFIFLSVLITGSFLRSHLDLIKMNLKIKKAKIEANILIDAIEKNDLNKVMFMYENFELPGEILVFTEGYLYANNNKNYIEILKEKYNENELS